MMRRKWIAGASVCTLAGLALTPAAASAQQAPAAPASTLGEVVVTAQRVEQNMERVPVAVTAFSADALRAAHVTSLGDIAQMTPGFTATAYNPAEPVYSIRGIGSDIGISQNAGGDPSVDVFVDGVYAGRGGTPDIDAMNLDRVEVLRGPQGTLFGKNAVGGLVQFVSKKPGPQTSADLAATYGGYNLMELAGHANLPIANNLFFEIGASARQHDGYTLNETTGDRVDDERIASVTSELRYLPTHDLEVILAADYTNQNQKGQPRHNVCDASFQGGVHCVGVNPDPRVVDAWTDGYIRRSLASVRGEINWTTPLGTFTSLTAFRSVRLNLQTPFFSNPVNPPAQIESTETDANRNNQFSQEVRLAFSALDGRLSGVAGAYYLHEHNQRVEVLDQQFFPGSTGIAAYPQDVVAQSSALFGQVDFRVVDGLKLTAGLRQTWESKSGEFAGHCVACAPGNLPPPLSGPYDVHSSKNWNALTPRFGVEWQAQPNLFVYFSAARGFKSGGYQGISGSAAGAATPYDPEFAWSYELGAKARLLQDRLQVNASIFKTDYTNLQVSQLVPLCCVVVTNAASADIKGAELEFVARPTPRLRIDGNYTYLDAVYTSYPSGAGGDYTGHILQQSPKNKLNLGAQYEFDVAGGRLTPRVEYSFTTRFFFGPDNIPVESQPDFSLVSGSISYQPDGKPWQISVWGRNLTNALVRTSVTDFPFFAQVLYAYQAPRTWGVTLKVKM